MLDCCFLQISTFEAQTSSLRERTIVSDRTAGTPTTIMSRSMLQMFFFARNTWKLSSRRYWGSSVLGPSSNRLQIIAWNSFFPLVYTRFYATLLSRICFTWLIPIYCLYICKQLSVALICGVSPTSEYLSGKTSLLYTISVQTFRNCNLNEVLKWIILVQCATVKLQDITTGYNAVKDARFACMYFCLGLNSYKKVY